MSTVTQTMTLIETRRLSPAATKAALDWRPYYELMRIKPFTTVIMFSPYLYGSLYAACVSEKPLSVDVLAWINFKLLLSSILSHSWACTWNDVADYKFDREVERCKNRPIARGAVSPRAGVIWTLIQVTFWVQFHAVALPQYSVWGLLAGVLAIIYPFSKRFTNYTPVVLGVIFAWGTLLGYVSTGGNLMEIPELSPRSIGLLALSAYTLAWVINFETIYAFQDMRDDMKAGINSMAVEYKASAQVLFTSSIFAETLFLLTVGWTMEACPAYILLAPVGNAYLQLRTQLSIDVYKPEECTAFFKKIPITTGLISCGLFGQYLFS